jgi:hypothetical protein
MGIEHTAVITAGPWTAEAVDRLTDAVQAVEQI